MKSGSGIIITLIILGVMTSMVTLLYLDLNYQHDIALLRNGVLKEKLVGQTACFWAASVAKARFERLLTTKPRVHTYQMSVPSEPGYISDISWRVEKNRVGIAARVLHNRKLVHTVGCDLVGSKLKNRYVFRLENWHTKQPS